MKQLIFLILLLFAIGAMCQPDPNVVMGDPGMQPGRQIQMPQQWNGMGFDMNRWREMNLENQLNQAEMLIELSDSGIFIYKAGVLAKLDYFNLAVQKKIELFGALPAKPVTIQQPPNVAGGQDKDSAKYTEEINKRTAQATIIQNQDALLFIIGDTFFKINPQTLNIDLQTDLAKKIVQPNPNVVDMRGLIGNNFLAGNGKIMQQNVYAKSKDNMLVFVKQDDIMVIDTLTGKIIARNALPAEFIVKPVGMYMNPGRIINQPAPIPPLTQPGGKMPVERIDNNAVIKQPGNVPQTTVGINTEKDMTVLVGTILMKNGFPILRADAGEEYLLAGPKITELTDKTRINKKYRLMGKILRDKTPPFGIGYFDVFSYLELNVN